MTKKAAGSSSSLTADAKQWTAAPAASTPVTSSTPTGPTAVPAAWEKSSPPNATSGAKEVAQSATVAAKATAGDAVVTPPAELPGATPGGGEFVGVGNGQVGGAAPLFVPPGDGVSDPAVAGGDAADALPAPLSHFSVEQRALMLQAQQQQLVAQVRCWSCAGGERVHRRRGVVVVLFFVLFYYACARVIEGYYGFQ